MKRRPELTVLFAGAERVARVDLASGKESAPLHSFVGPARAGASLAELLRGVFADGVRPAARTLVIAETAWTQTVELEQAAVAGLLNIESDDEGNILGFSVLKVSALKQAPLEISL